MVFAAILAVGLYQTTQPPAKVDIVSVTGCLREATANNWTLENATDPVPSVANAPPAKEIPPTPPAGRNSYRLIGVSEFNKAAPQSRINMTSVTMVAASCPAPAK
jgi:hypothetical protein